MCANLDFYNCCIQSNKGKSKSDKSSTAKATATEDSTKQATHRKPHSSANTQQEPSEEDYVESGVGSDARSIRSGSNSSLSSSDHGSVSSDDSDIVTVCSNFQPLQLIVLLCPRSMPPLCLSLQTTCL